MSLFIFDYDGLLVDSETLAFRAEQAMLQPFHVELTDKEFGKGLGMPVRDIMEMYKKIFRLPCSVEEMITGREEQLIAMTNELELMPGARELMTWLTRNQWTLAIASSGTHEHINRGIEKFGLQDTFATIASVQDVEHGKPHPDVVLEVLRRLSIPASLAMMADDAPPGIAAANAAGVFSIAVPPPDRERMLYNDASVICDDLFDLLAFLQRKKLNT